MSKQKRRWTSMMLVVALLLGTMFFPMESKAYNPRQLDGGGTVTIQATQPYTGPLPGAVAMGAPVRCSEHQNIKSAYAAINVLTRICGLGAIGAVSRAIASLASLLYRNNSYDQYYTRTWYYDQANGEGYYKYDFYADPHYEMWYGTAYSPVYSYLY